ncbi:SMI1/KNR4 family protein [Pyxidicoccus fallax]|uniref:SMI1/KNR4 family protein n=1 Tax=Pyxidicoccus fallax TaxID=394095 RepID=A0A848LUR7_9BACT|nr:SMI1/KNR4 family protein [Pyxidicoccus fallax]NMO21223.1 SMI1/KNR4 family protein [Pyxidicoccus fallax]NPC82337.1 SMI1/KNR4 family protein [Pyxidicoccus fallax]
MKIEDLLAEVSRAHYPRPPATPAQVAAFEARVGWRLDDELRAFYLHCDGAELFRPLPDANYSLLPLSEIQRARVAIWGQDEDAAGSPSWYTLVDCQDTDFVLVDVAQQHDGRYPLLDAYHGTYPRVRPIATSFREFLERALHSGDTFFWLRK